MVHVGVDRNFAHMEVVLAATVLELERNKEKILKPGPKDDIEQIQVNIQNIKYLEMTNVLCDYNCFAYG
jgi:hypothetical protein